MGSGATGKLDAYRHAQVHEEQEHISETLESLGKELSQIQSPRSFSLNA